MKNNFERGYFCAVAALLKMEGQATTSVKELFNQGGDWRMADSGDIELFKDFKLID